jgi:outer membrane biogenesis lipoprotein LolB
VTIVEANGTVHREHDTAETMERWLGVSVPVAALVHWLRGEPNPESPVTDERFEATDRIHLRQLAWRLDFTGYKDVPGGGRLPSRIVASRDDVRVTLLPKEWTFSQSAQ